jgi:GAF domain-containing protein
MIVDTRKKQAGLALLLVAAVVLSLSLSWGRVELPLLLFSILAALASSLDLPFSAGGIGMVHLAVIAAFLTMGLGPAIPASLASILLAGLLKRPWSTSSERREPLLTVLFNGILCSLALWLSGQAYLAFGTHDPVDGWSWPGLLPVGVLLSGYALIRHAFLMGRLRIGQESIQRYYRYNAWLIVSLDLLLLPLAVGVAAVYLQIGPWDFVAFCGLLVGLSILLRKLGESRRRHLEKLLQELSIVYEMGQAVAANLELDKLLETLYRQVSQLVEANNFYVALYDPVSDLLSFPIAFERAQHKHYTSRRAGGGLCERVIETKQPLLIGRDVSQKVKDLGLEMIGRPAASWLGVPLIAGDDVLGVMVVQSFERIEAYDQEDQQALTMLASQAAVAIENARLYGRTQRRAVELALLNIFSTAVSATLDLERVLQIVVSSVMSITNGQKSAIYLLQSPDEALYLAGTR